MLRLTLFTRAKCALCDQAKRALADVVAGGRSVEYKEVDIDQPGNLVHRHEYGFHVPVLHIQRGDNHVQRMWHRIDKVALEEKIKETMAQE